MKYIFLDVDGVLNNIRHYKKQHKKYGGRFICKSMPFNPRSLRNLQRIVKHTKANIILTSSWRRSKECRTVLDARLAEYGLKIHDITEFIDGDRGREIACYINSKEIGLVFDGSRIIIIDDEIKDIKRHFDKGYIVKTNPNKGLTLFKTIEALWKLRTIYHD